MRETQVTKCSIDQQAAEYADDLTVQAHSLDEYVGALMTLVPASATEELRRLFKSEALRVWNARWSYDDAQWMFLAHAEISPELSNCEAL